MFYTKSFFYTVIILSIFVSVLSTQNTTQVKKLEECTKNEQCKFMNVCQNNKCVHKTYFPPYTEEIVGSFAIMLGSAVSNAGGIGGGGLLIPILILILSFQTKEAIPISKLMIFTGALTAFLMGLKNKHPHRNGIPLDINIAGVLIPMLLFGTMVGVSLNKVFPPSLILISLTFVLLVNTYKTTNKGVKLFKKENVEFKKKKELGDTEECQSLRSSGNDSVKSNNPDTNNSCNKLRENLDSNTTNNVTFKEGEVNTTLSDNQSIVTIQDDSETVKMNDLLAKEYEKDKINFPSDKMKLIGISFVLLVIVSLFKGSDHFESLIKVKPCSSPYWVLYFVYLPLAVSITYNFAERILREYNYRKKINYPFDPTDVKWTVGILVRYPLYAFFGGTMAGLLGIGGGLIFGPLLLELGLNPIVSTATSNFLVLFTSSSTSLQFILLGTMNFHYGSVCTVCSTVGSYFGTKAIQKIIEKTGRSSVLIFAMALVEALSSICIPLHTYFEMSREYSLGRDVWGFTAPC